MIEGLLQVVGDVFHRLGGALTFTHHSSPRLVINTPRARSSSMICMIREGIWSAAMVPVCARIGGPVNELFQR
jgi:hypothetical protein